MSRRRQIESEFETSVMRCIARTEMAKNRLGKREKNFVEGKARDLMSKYGTDGLSGIGATLYELDTDIIQYRGRSEVDEWLDQREELRLAW